MVRSPTRSHLLVLPLVVLALVLLEEYVEYELRLHVHSVPLRTALIMLCYASGFTFAADKLSPWLKRWVVRVRSTSRRGGGKIGVWIFFSCCYAALFYAYLRLELNGPSGLFETGGTSQ